MMNFWSGFVKRAEEAGSPIADWMAEARDEDEKAKKEKGDPRVDPRELSEWRSPDVYQRWWP